MAVIFLHRQYSLQPFARHYRHADELVLDMFCVPEREGDSLVVKSEFAHQISQDIRDNHFVTCGGFSKPSIADYLYLLEQIGQVLCKLGRNVLLYLAAAVSDFYLPESSLSDHKIQSDEGTLTLKLEPVPKLIRPLVKYWCPDAFIVSFKLETDPDLLLSKSRAALERYQHNCVVANVLSERRHKITIVRRDQQNIVITSADGEIEEALVDNLLSLFHKHWQTLAQ